MNAIEIENLNFSYENKKILDNITFNIKKRKLTGVLGPNGCGKSTLLQNILGYLNEKTNAIKILGRNRKNISSKENAKTMSFVPQKSRLNTNMTVYDFAMLGRIPHIANPWVGFSSEDNAITKDILDKLHLSALSERIAITLSGGEFQMVLLARALIQDTCILLLDEPTSALDLNHSIALMKKIKSEIEFGNITALVVLHDLNLASLFCDELIMMKDGKIFIVGTPKDVLTKENIMNVYHLDCNISFTDSGKPYIVPNV
ncbi:MAG: ABC transporter ATP-binding protein [Fusobacteriaceae bacterium]|jgi:iron complex transport system ATP-binding protein|nr:ABC transporter ATP-binding protein [Fusobacteriaceae bacterium]